MNLKMLSLGYNPRIMRLLVFVGAGSPELPQYQDVYELLQKAAPKFGYSETDWSIRWNGQSQQPHLCDEPIRLTAAVEEGSRKIAEYERLGLEYDLLGRSFGGLVAASCVASRWPKGLRRLILWGPPVYWKMWEKFVRDFDESRAYNLTKGVRVENDYFDTLIPLESLIQQLSGPVRLATGNRDTYCSPAFLAYVASLPGGMREKPTVRIVEGASHEVTSKSPSDVVSSYLDALFA